MLVKCSRIAGQLRLSGLNDLILDGGQIIDLHKVFSPEEITREMLPPKGSLHVAFENGWIEYVQYNSQDFKNHLHQEDLENEKRIKDEIKAKMREILVSFWRKHKGDKIRYIKSLSYSYYDVLLEINKSEKDNDVIYAIERRISDFSDLRIKEGFVLI